MVRIALSLTGMVFLLAACSACESPQENFSFSTSEQLADCGGMSIRNSQGTDAEKRARVFAMYEDYRRSAFPSVSEIDVAEAKSALEAGDAILVDTRLDSERKISTIPGAISQAAFEQNAEQYRGKLIINYCTIGYRSGVYTRKLSNRGFQAKNLKGSVLAWAHAGFDFEHDGQPTKCAHVYGEDWNLLPKDYKPVW